MSQIRNMQNVANKSFREQVVVVVGYVGVFFLPNLLYALYDRSMCMSNRLNWHSYMSVQARVPLIRRAHIRGSLNWKMPERLISESQKGLQSLGGRRVRRRGSENPVFRIGFCKCIAKQGSQKGDGRFRTLCRTHLASQKLFEGPSISGPPIVLSHNMSMQTKLSLRPTNSCTTRYAVDDE